MKALLFLSSAQKRYVAFIAWGLVQGIITYLVLILLAPISYRSLENAMICVFAGSIVSALVFGLLLKTPAWLQPLGFLIVGALLPYVVMIVWGSIDYHRLVIQFDPLATVITLIWTACSLPFALLAAVLYFTMWLVSKRKQDATPSANSGTPSAELNG